MREDGRGGMNGEGVRWMKEREGGRARIERVERRKKERRGREREKEREREREREREKEGGSASIVQYRFASIDYCGTPCLCVNYNMHIYNYCYTLLCPLILPFM